MGYAGSFYNWLFCKANQAAVEGEGDHNTLMRPLSRGNEGIKQENEVDSQEVKTIVDMRKTSPICHVYDIFFSFFFSLQTMPRINSGEDDLKSTLQNCNKSTLLVVIMKNVGTSLKL